MSGSSKIIIALLALIAGFLGFLAFGSRPMPVRAAEAGNLTALAGDADSIIYILDSENEVLIAYRLLKKGGGLYPVSTRFIAYDLKLAPETMNEKKGTGLKANIRPGSTSTPKAYKEQIEKIKKAKERADKKKR